MRLEVPWLIYYSHPVEGHAFLRGSVSPADLTAEERDILADFTDRSPGYGDGRPSWTPYPAGRLIGRYYVVTSTRPDLEATRPGSIVTQALLFAPGELTKSADLGSALHAASGLLPEEGHMMVEFADTPAPVGDAGRAVVAALVQAAGKPVAVIGEEGWHAAVAGLWAALWPEARSRFHFRAFEAPHHLVDDPDVLLVPGPGRSWTSPAWEGVVVRNPFLAASEPPVLGLLRDPAGPLAGQMTGSARDLRRANVLAAALRDVADGVPQTAFALTALDRAPIREEASRELAEGLAIRVGQSLLDQDAAVVETLGDVPARFAAPLHVPVASWFERAFVARPQEARQVAESAGAQSWLSVALRTGLERLQPVESSARVLWQWWRSEALRVLTLPALGSEWDQVLARTTPEQVEVALLRAEALARGWPRLYGVLSAHAQRLDDLLGVPAQVRATALEGARAALDAPTFLAWAVQQAEEQVLDAAAHSLAADPGVLRDVDLTQGSWLSVWTRALRDLTVPDPAGRHADVLALLLSDGSVPGPLLLALAQGGKGNLMAHPDRDRLLPRLPRIYSEQTADAYLQSTADPGAPGATLLPTVRSRLQHVTASPAAARQLLMTAGLNHSEMMMVEGQAARAITVEDTTLIENLPLASARRLLGSVASELRWTFRHRLKPLDAVLLASGLNRSIDEATWWSALEQFVLEGYIPARSLWDQLKWSTADFPGGASDRENWQHALRELRHERRPEVWRVLDKLEDRRTPATATVHALRRTRFP